MTTSKMCGLITALFIINMMVSFVIGQTPSLIIASFGILSLTTMGLLMSQVLKAATFADMKFQANAMVCHLVVGMTYLVVFFALVK